MEVCVCKVCKRKYIARTKSYCCAECKECNEIMFRRIEDYLKQYPNSNAMQLASGLDLPVDTIIAFIDEGRLSFSKGTFERLK